MSMDIIDRLLQYSRDHVSAARQELLKTRQFLSENEHDQQDLRSLLQRTKLMRGTSLDVNFGSVLCDYIDSSNSLRNSQNALATHIAIAMSFVAESIGLIADSRLATMSNFQYLSQIRFVLSDIRLILRDFDTRQIPKDGIASAIVRVEVVARTIESTRSAEIADILRSIRQSIAYY